MILISTQELMLLRGITELYLLYLPPYNLQLMDDIVLATTRIITVLN
jgi:hypothetical protein